MRTTTEPYLSRGKDGGSQISFPVGNKNPSIIRPQLLTMSRTSSQWEPHPFPAGNREGAISHFQLEMTVRFSEWLGNQGFGKCVCQQKAASRHINGLAQTGKWFPRVRKSHGLSRAIFLQIAEADANDRKLRISDITSSNAATAPTIYGRLKNLIEMGLIWTKTDFQHGRVQLLYLTPMAQTNIKKAAKEIDQICGAETRSRRSSSSADSK